MLKKVFQNKKTLIITAVIGVVAVGGFISIQGSASTASQNDAEQVYLRTQTLSREVLEETVTGTGTVSANESASIYTTVSNAKISDILVSTSEYVTEGETMFTLDMTSLNEDIAEKEEDIAERTATLQSTFNDAKEDAGEAWGVVYNSGGTKEIYDNALSDFNRIKDAISYLQTAYDASFKVNEDATIAVNNANSALQSFINTMPTITVISEPTDNTLDNYDELLAEYENYINVLEPQYQTDIANYNSQLAVYQKALDDAKAAQAITLADLLEKETALKDEKTALNYSSYETAYNNAKQTYDSTLASFNTLLDKQIVADDAMYDDTTLKSYNDQLEDLYSQREDYYIKAEISGQVTEINTEVGSVVGPSASLAKIQATDTLEIDISIPESEINKVEVGQSATITTDAFEETLEGVVVEISSTATNEGYGSTSSSFTVTIDVKNEISGLLVGMNAQADIIVASQESEFIVPLSAIETEGNVSSIYIQTGDELIEENFTKIEVEVLENDGYYTQIKSSELTEGMKVVTTLNAETTTLETTEEEMSIMMPGIGGGGGQTSGGGTAPGGTTGGGPRG